ncbi:MAG: hypothetical protein ACJA0R_000636 [Zhongshania aliphaticivorans]|jgi:hypothetical protein
MGGISQALIPTRLAVIYNQQVFGSGISHKQSLKYKLSINEKSATNANVKPRK